MIEINLRVVSNHVKSRVCKINPTKDYISFRRFRFLVSGPRREASRNYHEWEPQRSLVYLYFVTATIVVASSRYLHSYLYTNVSFLHQKSLFLSLSLLSSPIGSFSSSQNPNSLISLYLCKNSKIFFLRF